MLKRIILYFVLISGCLIFSANANINDLRNQLAEIRVNIDHERKINLDLKETLESRYTELDELKEKLKSITAEIDSIKSRFNL